ncbi:MAG: DUF1294 domain-containing protein [Bacteroidetes bacterium]|nr:DUF1294 domain-containing protein [Bacteroidota bacterium]
MPQAKYIEATKNDFIYTTTIETYFYFILAYLIVLNLIAYVIMWYDKIQSKNKGNRIAENTLFFIAFIGGALGIYLGMKAPVNHKSAKLKFRIGIPLLILVNGVVVYFAIKYLG